MASATTPTNPWPNGARAAVSFTMDNLGEAQDVRTGAHPADEPIGQSPAVLDTLPRMLDLLDNARAAGGGEGGIKATYFAESWSLAVYPAAVADLRRRGHEVAWHGYQHEVWGSLTEAEERDNFSRSFSAAADAAAAAAAAKEEDVFTYDGFRPPGGVVNGARTFALLRDHGCSYVSPLGAFGVDGATGIVVLPFEWGAVDAFWYMDKFAGVRREHGVHDEDDEDDEDEAEAQELGGGRRPGQFRDYLLKRLGEVKREGGYMSILFHPFLQTGEQRFEVLEEVLAEVGGDPDLWVAPCREVARWVTAHRDQFRFET